MNPASDIHTLGSITTESGATLVFEWHRPADRVPCLKIVVREPLPRGNERVRTFSVGENRFVEIFGELTRCFDELDAYNLDHPELRSRLVPYETWHAVFGLLPDDSTAA